MFQHLAYILDRLHLFGSFHLDVTAQEQNPLRCPLDVQHFLDRRSLEQTGQEIVALIVAVEVEVHVLVHGVQFVCRRFV